LLVKGTVEDFCQKVITRAVAQRKVALAGGGPTTNGGKDKQVALDVPPAIFALAYPGGVRMGAIAGKLTPGSGIVASIGGAAAQEFGDETGASEAVQTAYTLRRAPVLIGHGVSTDICC